jgi:hypothetical protein
MSSLQTAAWQPFLAAEVGVAVHFTANIRPLRVLKQILVMFCSACGPGLARTHAGLPRYLLNRESRQLPDGLEVYVALLNKRSMASRQSGVTGRVDIATGSVATYSEIAFPPFVLILALNSATPDARLSRLTWLNNDGYMDRRAVTLLLDCVQTNTYRPGDYSTIEKLEEISARRSAGPPRLT